MTDDLQSQTDLLHHAPEGTVLEVAAGMFLVRGKTATYECNWDEETCNCPSFIHRLKGFGTCRHLAMLKEWMGRGDHTCPLCRGEGCGSCEGLGKVSGDIYPILKEIRIAEDEARVALIKEIFA